MKRIIILMMMVMGMSCGHSSSSFYYQGTAPRAEAAQRHIKIWVDTGFGESDRTGMNDAVAQWNYAMNGYITFEIVSYQFDMEIDTLRRVQAGEGWLFLKIDHTNSMIHDVPGTATLAFVNKVNGEGNRIYFVRDRMYNEWVSGLTLHEMGHLLGAEHSEGTLMDAYFSIDNYRCVDQDTIKQVAAQQHLKADNLKYCTD